MCAGSRRKPVIQDSRQAVAGERDLRLRDAAGVVEVSIGEMNRVLARAVFISEAVDASARKLDAFGDPVLGVLVDLRRRGMLRDRFRGVE